MVWAVSLSTTELIPRRLTPDALAALRGLVGFGKDKPPEPIQRPTRGDSPVGAAPQCLSGRTSYLRVRLAFHPYPQLVQPICNSGRCGPPRPVTGASPWSWVAHAVSGPVRATPRLATRASPFSDSLALCHSTSKSFGRRADGLAGSFFNRHAIRDGDPCPSDRSRADGFRLYFTPVSGFFSPFPHGTLPYRSLDPFSLGTWASRLPPGFLVSGGTRVRPRPPIPPAPTGLSPP